MIKNKAMIINLINIVVAYLIGLDKRNCLMNSAGNEFIPVGTVTNGGSPVWMGIFSKPRRAFGKFSRHCSGPKPDWNRLLSLIYLRASTLIPVFCMTSV